MSTAERRVTVAAVVVPFAGFCLALWLLWGGAVAGRDLCILAVMYALVGFGITIGFPGCCPTAPSTRPTGHAATRAARRNDDDPEDRGRRDAFEQYRMCGFVAQCQSSACWGSWTWRGAQEV
jgi:hypothetical protein